MRLRSERIVFFYGCGITREARIFTVFELMDCALSDTLWAERSRGEDDEDDESRIVVNKPLLPWSQRLQYAADAAEGMKYLHSRNPPLLHRDLKSLNILVKGGRAKICDFGASKALQLGGLEDEYDLDSSSSRGQHVRSYTLGSLSSASKARNKKKKKNTSLSTFKNLLGSSSSSTSIKTPLLKSASAALSFASIPSSSTDDEEDTTNHHRTSTTSTIESMSRKPRLLSSSSFSQAPLMTTKIGTPQWLAPELLCSDSENVPYSLPIDVYSFGCVLFELMCQKPPWYFGAEKANSILPHHFHSVFVLQEVLSSGDRPRVPVMYSADAPRGFQDLMHSCWKRNSSRRPKFDSIFLELRNMIEKGKVDSTSSGSSFDSSSNDGSFVLLNNQDEDTKEEKV